MLYPDSAYEALDFNELKQMVSKFAISRNGRQAIVEMLPNPNQIEV
jgi:dsDNA-specific endonuclease/ATPase MutS2